MCFTSTPTIPESFGAGGSSTIQSVISELAKCCIVTGVSDGLAESGIMAAHFPNGAPDKCMFLTAVRDNTSILWSFDKGINWIEVYTGTGIGTGIKTGSIIQWGGGVGSLSVLWLPCDGRAIDRIIYADLFGIIGTTYGVGDGSQTFNLPDFRGRVPIGANYGDLPNGNDVTYTTRNIADEVGAETHTLIEAELSSHAHIGKTGSDTNRQSGGSNPLANAGNYESNSVGGDGGHANIQASRANYYIIRL